MTSQAAAAALLEGWLTCGYAPALSPLSFPRYPFRELRPRPLPDGAVELTIAKRGFGYKYRGRRPSEPPPVDTCGVRSSLTPRLPSGITIRSVTDKGREVKIVLEETKQCANT